MVECGPPTFRSADCWDRHDALQASELQPAKRSCANRAVADQPTILVARKDVPVKGFREFVLHLKYNASTMRMGTAGVGSTGFVDCSPFNGMVGVSVTGDSHRGSDKAAIRQSVR